MQSDDHLKISVRQGWKQDLRPDCDGGSPSSSVVSSPPVASVPPRAETPPRRSRPSAAKSACIIVGMILVFVVIVIVFGQTGKDSQAPDLDGKKTQAENARNREGRRSAPIAKELRGQR